MQPGHASPATIALWSGFCGESAPASLTPVLTSLLQLYIFTRVSDPPMHFNADEVATTLPFSAEVSTAIDDKIKPGKPCIVLCPALYSADGLLKAKAKVLALDYL